MKASLVLLGAGGASAALLSGGSLVQQPRAEARPSPTMSNIWTPSARGEPGQTPRDLAFGEVGQYCEDLYKVTRRKTRTVTAGSVKFGSEHPLVRQTMATTLTSDVEGSADQIMRCADEGFDLVRLTVVGMKDAKACHGIKETLLKKGYDIPLCADMHFQPKVKRAEKRVCVRANDRQKKTRRASRAPHESGEMCVCVCVCVCVCANGRLVVASWSPRGRLVVAS